MYETLTECGLTRWWLHTEACENAKAAGELSCEECESELPCIRQIDSSFGKRLCNLCLTEQYVYRSADAVYGKGGDS